MPYNKTADLPSAVRDRLPTHGRRIFMEAFNSALKQYKDETTAFRVAWAAVKKGGYGKSKGDTTWERKDTVLPDIRLDRGKRSKAKCKMGNSCGDVCIPKNAECHQSGSSKKVNPQKDNRVRDLALTAGAIALVPVVATAGTFAGIAAYESINRSSREKKQEDYTSRKRSQEWQQNFNKQQEERNKKREKEDEESQKKYEETRKKYEQVKKEAEEAYKKTTKAREVLSKEDDPRRTSSGKNWWEVLEVNANASPDEIKRARVRLQKLYHPDLNKNIDPEISKEINQAADIGETLNQGKKKKQPQQRKNSAFYEDEIEEAYDIAKTKYPDISNDFWDNPVIRYYDFRVSQAWKTPMSVR